MNELDRSSARLWRWFKVYLALLPFVVIAYIWEEVHEPPPPPLSPLQLILTIGMTAGYLAVCLGVLWHWRRRSARRLARWVEQQRHEIL